MNMPPWETTAKGGQKGAVLFMLSSCCTAEKTHGRKWKKIKKTQTKEQQQEQPAKEEEEEQQQQQQEHSNCN